MFKKNRKKRKFIYFLIIFLLLFVNFSFAFNKNEYQQQETINNNIVQKGINNQNKITRWKWRKIVKKYKKTYKKIKWEKKLDYLNKERYIILIDYVLKNVSIKSKNEFNLYIDKIYIGDYNIKEKGLMKGRNIILNLKNIENDFEFMYILIHELGHIYDLNILVGDIPIIDKKYTEFKRHKFLLGDPSLEYYNISWKNETKIKSKIKEINIDINNLGKEKGGFCSEYGKTDIFEDFAECFSLFLINKKKFKELSLKNNDLKKKYIFFEKRLK